MFSARVTCRDGAHTCRVVTLSDKLPEPKLATCNRCITFGPLPAPGWTDIASRTPTRLATTAANNLSQGTLPPTCQNPPLVNQTPPRRKNVAHGKPQKIAKKNPASEKQHPSKTHPNPLAKYPNQQNIQTRSHETKITVQQTNIRIRDTKPLSSHTGNNEPIAAKKCALNNGTHNQAMRTKRFPNVNLAYPAWNYKPYTAQNQAVQQYSPMCN